MRAPHWEQVKEKGEALRKTILEMFPNVDAEFVDRKELVKRNKGVGARGYPAPQSDIHGYLLITGKPTMAEEAATFAVNEVADLWEQTGIVIDVRATNEVWCRKAGLPKLQPVRPAQRLEPLFELYSYEDKERGVWFGCVISEPHEHEWGKFKPKG